MVTALLLLALLLLLLALLKLSALLSELSHSTLEAPTTPGTFSNLQVGVILVHLMEEEKGETGPTKNSLNSVGYSTGYPTSLKRGPNIFTRRRASTRAFNRTRTFIRVETAVRAKRKKGCIGTCRGLTTRLALIIETSED